MDETPIRADRPGLTLTAGVAATSGAVPVDSRGRASSAVRVTVLSSAAVHIRTGSSNVAATVSDLLLVGGESVLIDTSGKTHISVLQAGLGLGGLVNVVAYE